MNPYEWIEDNFMLEPREYTKGSKSEDEIKKLLYDESVSELERFEKNITSDNLYQKVSVYNQLHRVFSDNKLSKVILPIVVKQLPSDGIEMQIHAGEGFIKAFEHLPKVDENIVEESFMLSVQILGQWNNDVINCWIRVFELVIKIIDWNSVKIKLEKLLTHLSHTSQPVQGRYAAARMISVLAKHKGSLIEGIIFNRAVHLSKDFEKIVRLTLAKECLEVVFVAAKNKVNKNILFEKILELIYDPDEEVKLATINVLILLIDHISETEKREKVAQIFTEISSNLNEDIIKLMSSNLAHIILKMGDIVLKNNSMLNSFMNFYKEVSKSSSEEVKCNFVLNLPAMIKYVDPKLYGTYKVAFLQCASGDNSKLRLYWITVLFDIIELAGPTEINELLLHTLEDFIIEEKDASVLEAILSKIDQIYLLFYNAIEDEKEAASNSKSKKKKEKPPSFISVFQEFFERVSKLNQWRIKSELIQKLYQITVLNDLSGMIDSFAEFILDMIEDSSRQIRKEAADSLVKAIVRLNTIEKRSEIIQQVNERLCNAKKYQKREAYIFFCESALEYFSKLALNHFLLNNLLCLSSDKVLSIQMQLVEILPKIKLAIGKLDEVVAKRFKQAIKTLDELQNERINQMLIRSLNTIQLHRRNKQFSSQIEKKYRDNMLLESEMMLYEIGGGTLEELYKKEEKNRRKSQKMKAKGNDSKKGLPPTPNGPSRKEYLKLPSLGLGPSSFPRDQLSSGKSQRYPAYYGKKIKSSSNIDKLPETRKMPEVSGVKRRTETNRKKSTGQRSLSKK